MSFHPPLLAVVQVHLRMELHWDIQASHPYDGGHQILGLGLRVYLATWPVFGMGEAKPQFFHSLVVRQSI